MGVCASRHKASSDSSRAGEGRAVAVATSSSAASGTASNSNQAQSKRDPVPHMFHEIVAQEKTASAAELEDQVHGAGIYLAGKTKKYWVHEETKCNCFMLFPRGLFITWSEDPRYWSWHTLKETNGSEIEAVFLQNVCWLEIHGKLELSHLTPGVSYDVVFEVMLTEPLYGWTVPVNLRLKLPDGTVQERKEKLQKKPRNQWLELKAGEVEAQPGQKGEVEISLFEYGGQWKKGLHVKGIKVCAKRVIVDNGQEDQTTSESDGGLSRENDKVGPDGAQDDSLGGSDYGDEDDEEYSNYDDEEYDGADDIDFHNRRRDGGLLKENDTVGPDGAQDVSKVGPDEAQDDSLGGSDYGDEDDEEYNNYDDEEYDGTDDVDFHNRHRGES